MSKREPISVFVTTLNNGRTLGACLESVKWADELLVLDSYSHDNTEDVARSYGAKFCEQKFLGYGPQKQLAMEMTENRWVMLMDADEMLTPELAAEIQALLEHGPTADGYTMRRRELLYWQMAHVGTHHTRFLRLFDKTKGKFSDKAVHGDVKVPDGKIEELDGLFYHFGDVDIHARAEKFNKYSTGIVAERVVQGKKTSPWRMLFYPPLFFLRMYVLHRNFLSGWAGFVSSANAAYYAFLKCAKNYEHWQVKKLAGTELAPGAPEIDRRRDIGAV